MESAEIREKILIPAIQRANISMPHFSLEKLDENIVFYGRPKAILDSLHLVSFVFIIEEVIEDVLNIKITITTQDVLDTESAPFASVANLVQFIQKKITQTKE